MKILIAALITVLLVSCRDDYEITTVEGKVINFGNKEPIDCVKVSIFDGLALNDSWTGSGNTSSDVMDETLTDENGNFKVIFRRKISTLYSFR